MKKRKKERGGRKGRKRAPGRRSYPHTPPSRTTATLPTKRRERAAPRRLRRSVAAQPASSPYRPLRRAWLAVVRARHHRGFTAGEEKTPSRRLLPSHLPVVSAVMEKLPPPDPPLPKLHITSATRNPTANTDLRAPLPLSSSTAVRVTRNVAVIIGTTIGVTHQGAASSPELLLLRFLDYSIELRLCLEVVATAGTVSTDAVAVR
ncbi:uncharacterized protein DS421_18g627540 [Arachis hypogaea]|nr:uncharacterized protein DS421_18g627540 [Arachis hypogaea]